MYFFSKFSICFMSYIYIHEEHSYGYPSSSIYLFSIGNINIFLETHIFGTLTNIKLNPKNIIINNKRIVILSVLYALMCDINMTKENYL